MNDLNFEQLRANLEDLSVPQGQVRHMRWLATMLAVGRTTAGDYEIFICGSELRATHWSGDISSTATGDRKMAVRRSQQIGSFFRRRLILRQSRL